MRSGSKAAQWEQTTRRPEWWWTVPRAQQAVRRHRDERGAGAQSPVFAALDSHTRNFLASTSPIACQATRYLHVSRAQRSCLSSIHTTIQVTKSCKKVTESNKQTYAYPPPRGDLLPLLTHYCIEFLTNWSVASADVKIKNRIRKSCDVLLLCLELYFEQKLQWTQ